MEDLSLKEEALRQEIVLAGLRLCETGLVARTWGNISARLSDEHLLIKPSGRDYHSIRPEDIVRVGTWDLSYDPAGPKPSSEKAVHAGIYRLRPDAKYVVHTHQFYASAGCAECEDIRIEQNGILSLVPCAVYAEPGSPALWENIAAALATHPSADAVLMARHGCLVFADSMVGCFQKSLGLEEGCRRLFLTRVPQAAAATKKESTGPVGFVALTGKKADEMDCWLDDYAMMVPLDYRQDDPQAFRSVSEKNAAASLYVRKARPIPQEEALRQHESYVNSYSKLK